MLHFLAAQDAPPGLLDAAAAVLAEEWPGPWSTRLRLRRGGDGLPAHFLLIRCDEAAADDVTSGSIVAHGSLHAAATIETDTVLQSLIVSPAARRQGYGRVMLQHLERVAAARDYSFLTLSTADQVPFYKACGYRVCQPAQVSSAATAAAGAAAVSALEAMLARQLAVASDSGDAGGGRGSAAHTWLRKRLLMFPSPRPGVPGAHAPPLDAFAATVAGLVAHASSGRGGRLSGSFLYMTGWRKQTGPSCGLTAAKVVADTLWGGSRRGEGGCMPATVPLVTLTMQPDAEAPSQVIVHLPCPTTDPLPPALMSPETSLFSSVVASGASSEGEMFSSSCLASLLREQCGLEVEAIPREATIKESEEEGGAKSEAGRGALLARLRAAFAPRALPSPCLGVVAWDGESSSGNFTPTLKDGRAAHWGLITGAFFAEPAADDDEEDDDPLLVLVHTASALPVVTRLSLLWASNGQLNSVCDAAALSGWVVPPGGPQLGGVLWVNGPRLPASNY